MVLLTLTESKKCLIWFSSVTPLEAPESYSWIRNGDRNHWCSWNSQHRKATFAINPEPSPAYFKTKITVVFMLLVHRIIHKQCLCMQKTWKCTLVKCCSRTKWHGRFVLPMENYTDSLEQINFYFWQNFWV